MAFQYSSSSSQSYAGIEMSHSNSMSNYQPSTNFTLKEISKPDSDPLDISGEKKRNRLGYARTNMACGNCRKRKIRCLLVKGDGRCTQCIRLKKDCHFYAVDQEPSAPTGTRTGPRLLSKTMLALAATPPQIAPSRHGDVQEHDPYHGGTAASHGMSPPAFSADMYNEPSPGLPIGKPNAYGQDLDNWALTAETGDMNAAWRGYSFEPPIAASYSLHAMPGSQASMPWEMFPGESMGEPEGVPGFENMWAPYQQPTRSMSFSGEYPFQYGRAYDDRKSSVASDICYPTSIETVLYSTRQQPFQP
ncbi:hypothetical protein F4861DRAFT_38937 [Xylaria intraflava]|nr:hypothetical protein F4861DRAFT_38937 [Xylaria intraflava]